MCVSNGAREFQMMPLASRLGFGRRASDHRCHYSIERSKARCAMSCRADSTRSRRTSRSASSGCRATHEPADAKRVEITGCLTRGQTEGEADVAGGYRSRRGQNKRENAGAVASWLWLIWLRHLRFAVGPLRYEHGQSVCRFFGRPCNRAERARRGQVRNPFLLFGRHSETCWHVSLFSGIRRWAQAEVDSEASTLISVKRTVLRECSSVTRWRHAVRARGERVMATTIMKCTEV